MIRMLVLLKYRHTRMSMAENRSDKLSLVLRQMMINRSSAIKQNSHDRICVQYAVQERYLELKVYGL